MCIPLVFYFGIRKKVVSKVFILCSISIVYVLFLLFWGLGLVDQLLVYQALLFGDNKSIYYLMQQGSVFSIGMLAVFIFYFWTIIKIDVNKLSQNEIVIYNQAYMYILFFVISFFIPIFSRLTLYFVIPFACLLSLGITHAKFKTEKVIAMSLMVVFLGYSMYATLIKDWRYVPYSSYIQYIGRPKPSYQYRENYNYNNSPYKGIDEGLNLMEN